MILSKKYSFLKFRFSFVFFQSFFLGLIFFSLLSVYIIPLRNSEINYSVFDFEKKGLPLEGHVSARLTAPAKNFDEPYDYPLVPQAENTVRVPVLMYHHIANIPQDKKSQPYFVTPEMFEKQLQYLNEKGYKAVTPYEFYQLLETGKNPDQKTVMLTFDDGNYNNYEYAFPLLKKYGFVGVFYVCTRSLGIPYSKLKEMSDAGMVIDSHSSTHVDLAAIHSTELLTSELLNSRVTLENLTGKEVYSLAYPGCGTSSTVISVASSSGYSIGFSCGKSIDHTYGGRFFLSRMHVYNNFENFKKRLSGIYEWTADYSG